MLRASAPVYNQLPRYVLTVLSPMVIPSSWIVSAPGYSAGRYASYNEEALRAVYPFATRPRRLERLIDDCIMSHMGLGVDIYINPI